MKTLARTVLSLLLCAAGSRAENYLINGGQESRILYQLYQEVQPAQGTKSLILSFVVPTDFVSPTYNQRISDFALRFSVEPSSRREQVDERGNRIIRTTWSKPTRPVEVTMTFVGNNSVILRTLQSTAPFPLTGLADAEKVYLAATDQVQVDNARIAAKARELISGAGTEFDAVQRILSWVVDHMTYITPPRQYDALYSFESGRGNCQNYSHLSAALMRAVGIPVRIVNGVTLKKSYDIKNSDGSILTVRMGDGRHSWIEVYFPDLGWIPVDPQQTELFVSNRFIRIEVGLDNEEAVKDGLVRWTASRGSEGKPIFQESINAEFVEDRVDLTITKQNYGPQKLLLCPQVEARFQPVPTPPPPPPPVKISDQEVKQLRYSVPFIFGNLVFPEDIDFLSARGPAEEEQEGEFEMRRNFMVETAEYVTTQGTQYAQIVVLEKPLQLNKVGLALHKFGGEGFLWIELFDDADGSPGEYIATSDMVSLQDLSLRVGYRWRDFDFGTAPPLLSPGRYWIALGFSGSPIVNWFFTYGKPVGPEEGTKYRTIFDESWSRSLSYEFNYRVQGLTTR